MTQLTTARLAAPLPVPGTGRLLPFGAAGPLRLADQLALYGLLRRHRRSTEEQRVVRHLAAHLHRARPHVRQAGQHDNG